MPPSFGVNFAISNVVNSFSSSFNPSRLFTSGSRGFFYDFSDYSTQFTDTAGTTAITGVGQSLGLVLDKSAGLALGPELVTNGDFSNGLVGWYTTGTASASVVNGEAQVTNVSNLADRLEQIVVGSASEKTYRISADVRTSSGSARVQVLQNGASFLNLGFVDFSNTTTQRISFIATTTGGVGMLVRVTPRAGSAAQIVYVDNVSVRELPGNHATQATAGSRALTQVRPMFTQRNRAVGSELPENATYWQASVVQNGITMTKVASGTDTDGLPYVDVRYQGTAAGTVHDQICPFGAFVLAGAAGQSATCSVIARVIGGSTANVSGFWARVSEETAPSTFIGIALGAAVTSTTDTVTTATRAITTGNQFRATLALNFTNGATIDITYRVKGLMFELGSTRTTYQPAVSGELRNRAIGSGDVGNATYWPASVVNNGLTATKVASGIDTDGLPYVDVRYTGTATDTFHGIAYADQFSRGPATVGQSWTASLTARVLSGSLTNVNGIDARTVEETAPFTFVGQAIGNQVTASVDTRSVSTRVIASGNQVRLAVVLNVINGATIDITYRIKGLQFEQASTYSRYQRVVTANEWYEPGFTSYRGIQFDGVDDFLQTAAIDFAGAESLGSELVTNGDFSVGTGWTLGTGVTISGGVANLAAGSLYLEQGITTVAGRSYKVTATASNGAFCGAWDGANQNNQLSGSATTRTGTFSFTFTANDTQSFIAFAASGAGATTIDNVSVKEVLIPADKMTVVAGVRKLSDAGIGSLVELTIQPDNNFGAFALRTPALTPNSYAFRSTGSVGVITAPGTGFPAPDTAVLTGQADISGDIVRLNRNGVNISTATNDQGTGVYLNAPVFIGRGFGGTANPFNGVLTFLCVINRTLTAGELAALEAYANSRTGAY